MTQRAKKDDLYGKFNPVLDAVLNPLPDKLREGAKQQNSKTAKQQNSKTAKQGSQELRTFIDLFCGIGGFHTAGVNLGLECVFASDIDPHAREAYKHNYGFYPKGDIHGIKASDIPDHDLLCAGFPCQPFSIIGSRKGFEDPRGTLFFEIIRIVKEKRPKALMLENVKQLATINKGETMLSIELALKELGYLVEYRVLNALNYGLPQKRERVLIIATLEDFGPFPWPEGNIPMKPLSEILENKPDSKHFVSGRIKRARHTAHTSKHKPSIWHENKSGNISSYPYSCALRAGASYNYLLVDGERRLTPREMLRLQGFPDSFEIVCSDTQTRKQAGNAVPVPMIQSVMEQLVDVHARASLEGQQATG